MSSLLKDRLSELLDFLGYSDNKRKFAKAFGVSRQAMDNIYKGASVPKIDLLSRIAEEYPNVNYNWLLSGKGSMTLNTSEEEGECHEELLHKKREVELLRKAIADKEKIIQLLEKKD